MRREETWVVVRNPHEDSELFWTGEEWSQNFADADRLDSAHGTVDALRQFPDAVAIVNYGLTCEYAWSPIISLDTLEHDMMRLRSGEDLEFWPVLLDSPNKIVHVHGPYQIRLQCMLFVHASNLELIDVYGNKRDAVRFAKSWLERRGYDEENVVVNKD